MTLAQRIDEAIGERKPSEVARAVGKSESAVSQWRDGTTKSLRADTALKLEALTGYRASWIIWGTGPKQIGDGAGWPFPQLDRQDFDALMDWQKIEIQAKVREKIQEFAALNSKRNGTR